jgi:hypothetical protein
MIYLLPLNIPTLKDLKINPKIPIESVLPNLHLRDLEGVDSSQQVVTETKKIIKL